jgi:hypothetical protein
MRQLTTPGSIRVFLPQDVPFTYVQLLKFNPHIPARVPTRQEALDSKIGGSDFIGYPTIAVEWMIGDSVDGNFVPTLNSRIVRETIPHPAAGKLLDRIESSGGKFRDLTERAVFNWAKRNGYPELAGDQV